LIGSHSFSNAASGPGVETFTLVYTEVMVSYFIAPLKDVGLPIGQWDLSQTP
jgi:hypothetical protein